MIRMEKKIQSLQVLRAIMCILVFLSHSGIANGLFTWGGAYAVSVFIILSGFLTIQKVYNKEIKISSSVSYAINKIRKSYMLHLIILLIVFIPMLLNYSKDMGEMYLPILWKSFFYNIFLLHAFVPDSQIYFGFNPVSWYLSVMFFLYLFTPLFGKIIKYIHFHIVKDRKILWYFLIFVLWLFQCLIYYLFRYTQVSHWAIYINPLSRSLDFGIGMLAAMLYTENEASHKKNIVSDIIVILLVAFTVILLKISITWGSFTSVGTWTFISVAWVIVVTKNNFLIFSFIFNNKIFIYLGNVSGHIYLIHFMMLNKWSYLLFLCIGLDYNNIYIRVFVAGGLTVLAASIWQILMKKGLLWIKQKPLKC